MKPQYTELFHFESEGMPQDLFHVIRFQGTEGLNALFTFTIDLVSNKVDVDTAAILRNRGLFTVGRADGSRAVFSGYPAEVSQSGHFNGYTYYTVVLRPTFWKMCSLVQSRIFLNKTAKDAVTELLTEQKFFTFPHEFRLGLKPYPAPEFAMQYEESVYDYICWRLEEQGITWHIEQDNNVDKIVFSDTPRIYSALPGTPVLRYSPPSGMQVDREDEIITAFSLACHPLPQKVVIRTYNWKNPNRPVLGGAIVSTEGLGDVYLTTENVDTEADAMRVAEIRAEELRCRSRIFSGISGVPNMRPGYLFTLDNHYNPAFNREYFLTEVTHEGSQEAFLTLGLGIPLSESKEHFFYHNTFTCIESNVQYRPTRKAPRARVTGQILAFIDGAGSGARPELDEFGRYKVMFPFDISTRQKGNASCWIRMSQPQVGNKSGMSFPLLPGTEVTVAFLDGNPDRPVITGALPNGETGPLTTGANTNATGLRTPGGNQLIFNDTDNNQGILLGTPAGRGITISSGSLNSINVTSDMVMETATTMGAEISTLGKTLYTGFKNTNLACTGSTPLYLAAAGSLATGLAAPVFDVLASGDPNYAFGSDGAKILNAAIGAILDFYFLNEALTGAKSMNAYGVMSMHAGDMSVSQVQVKPITSDLVAGIIASVIGKGLQITGELAPTLEATVDKESPEFLQSGLTEEEYAKKKKTAAIHKMLTSSVASLLPEILTWVLTIKAIKNPKAKVEGGVLAQSLTTNVSTVAAGPVSMHSPIGVLINTRHVKSADKAVLTKEHPDATLKGFFPPDMPPSPASDWGTENVQKTQASALYTYMAEQKELGFEPPPIGPLPANPAANDPVAAAGPSYVATFTELALEQSLHHKTVVDETYSVQASRHRLGTLDNASQVIIGAQANDNDKLTYPGIALHVKQGDQKSLGIDLLLEGKNDKQRSIQLGDGGFVLVSKTKADAGSSIRGADDKLTLACPAKDGALITLDAQGVTLSLKGKEGIKLDDNAVVIAPDGKAQVAGIKFSGNSLESTTGGKITVGKELEILATTGPVKLSSLENSLKGHAQVLEKMQQELSESVTRLNKIAAPQLVRRPQGG